MSLDILFTSIFSFALGSAATILAWFLNLLYGKWDWPDSKALDYAIMAIWRKRGQKLTFHEADFILFTVNRLRNGGTCGGTAMQSYDINGDDRRDRPCSGIFPR
ncbi:MAG: hypothetical protein P1P89_22250 [Desulfobacterales bacterium]|nr:hypothetical protein [Desulfobacterales bacterium]